MTKAIAIKKTILGTGIPKICVPITAADREQIFRQAEAAVKAGADLVEWRADFYEELGNETGMRVVLEKLAEILSEIPLLFTIRTHREGGEFQENTEQYCRICQMAAVSHKADIIDVEVFGEEAEKAKLISSLKKEGCLVIASSHDFAKTDSQEELLNRFKRMNETEADILKMAVMPQEQEDVVALMRATKEMTELTEKPLISMSMGQMGSISRLSGENFGSCVTFGTVGAASAPGQFPIRELRTMLEAIHKENA